MAAWTEAEVAKIRYYLGMPAVFRQSDPDIDHALIAVLAKADGGSREDDSTQKLIQSWLTKLDVLEERMQNLWSQLAALQLLSLQIDPVRALYTLRSEGRRLVHAIAATLNTKPRRDVFSSSEYGEPDWIMREMRSAR